MIDVLVVSLGTTHGLRVADRLLVEMLAEAGVETQASGVRIGAGDRLRRGYPVNDLVEALAVRRALAHRLRRGPRPRALILSTTTAAFLADPDAVPYAVRLDSPAALNRPGARNAVLRGLERRSLARARLVLALGRAGAAALPAGSAPAEIVPVPVDAAVVGSSGERDLDLAVGYAPGPKERGLDVLCAAWEAAGLGGARQLEVYGIEEPRASAFLGRRGAAVPAGVTFRGLVSAQEFRARLAAARCLISATRWEDFGQSALEALYDGALLVTTPAAGAYEALPLARRLDPRLVAADLGPASLAAAIGAAFSLAEPALADYRRRAAELLEPYRRQAAVETLRERVLPALLGS